MRRAVLLVGSGSPTSSADGKSFLERSLAKQSYDPGYIDKRVRHYELSGQPSAYNSAILELVSELVVLAIGDRSAPIDGIESADMVLEQADLLTQRRRRIVVRLSRLLGSPQLLLERDDPRPQPSRLKCRVFGIRGDRRRGLGRRRILCRDDRTDGDEQKHAREAGSVSDRSPSDLLTVHGPPPMPVRVQHNQAPVVSPAS